MKLSRLGWWLGLVLFATLVVGTAWAVRVGESAPNFTGTDSDGRIHHLSDYRGKFVVLEWQNRGCPYVRKYYESGRMQRLQKEWTSRGVIWLTIISSAPGKQGHMKPEEANDYFRRMKAAQTAVLLDTKGTIGHLYDAKTTPDMYVINPQGILVYQGAIDNRPTPDPASLKGATNYLDLALSQAMAGKPVSTPVTRPYGCSVKYADGH